MQVSFEGMSLPTNKLNKGTRQTRRSKSVPYKVPASLNSRKRLYGLFFGILATLTVVIASMVVNKIGATKLYGGVTASIAHWNFSDPADYAYDTAKIDISGHQARLRALKAVDAASTVSYPITKAPDTNWIATDAGHDWLYRKTITISKVKVGATLTDFPVKVEIIADTEIGANAKPDLTDLRFSSSDGTTILAAEREAGTVNAGLANAIFWVRVPIISSTADTTIYAYYGNPAATVQSSPASVWDGNFNGVWHLKETGIDPQVNDSSLNANHSTSQTWTPTTGGMIGVAGSFNGSQNINVGDSSSLAFGTGDFSLSMWVKPDEYVKGGGLLQKNGADNNASQFWLQQQDDFGALGFATTGPEGSHLVSTSSGYLTLNQWQYITVVRSGPVQTIYKNGANVVSNTGIVAYTSNNAPLKIGAGSGSSYFKGSVDEVRASSAARSADWIKFEYYNQLDAAGQLAFGNQTEISDAGFAGAHYTVSNATAQNYVSVSGFSATASGTGSVKFQVSADGGATWNWWNGTAWAKTAASSWEANDAATISAHFADGTFNALGATVKAFKFRSFFNSDGTQLPILSSVGLSYSLDTAPPARPESVTLSSLVSGGVPLSESDWHYFPTPYFSWSASTDQANAGEIASGTNGYYVSFTTNANDNPTVYQTNPNYSVTGLVANNIYYLRVKARDNAGNISAPWTLFAYKYSVDNRPPQDPSALTAKTSADGTRMVANTNYNASNPYFSWTPAIDRYDNGSAYGQSVSGTAGYFVYFGTDSSAIPCSSGSYQTESYFIAPALISDATYYLLVQPKDKAGNVTMNPASSQSCFASNVWAPFAYKYDGTAPKSAKFVSAFPVGYTRSNHFVFSWPVSGADGPSDEGGSGLAKYQYKIDAGNWTDVTGGASTSSLTLDNPAVRTGAHTFNLRAVDGAGNVDQSPPQTNFYFDDKAPLPPKNLKATPTSSDPNSFAFSWGAPAGDIAGYFYAVNPVNGQLSETNTSYTTATSLPADAFATRQGANTFYIIAKDKAGNHNFDACAASSPVEGCARVSFTATAAAPSIPTNVRVADTSKKNGSSCSVSLKWLAPTNQAVSPAGYAVERSNDGITFSNLATTPDTSYADENLSSRPYYYRVKAQDGSGKFSPPSATVSIAPKVTYSVPPALIGSVDSNAATYSSHISWLTNREASSVVKFGKNKDNLDQETSKNTEMVKKHEIVIKGLDPETTYYYYAAWTDSDGNQGRSGLLSFQTRARSQLSDFKVSDITPTSAKIIWNSTSVSSMEINYGKNNSYGIRQSDTSDSHATGHFVVLDKLSDATVYHIQVVGTDYDGTVLKSNDYTFLTLLQPAVSDIKIEPVKGALSSTIRFTFTTNVATRTSIGYLGNNGHNITQANPNYTTNHDIQISGLAFNSRYAFQVSGVDARGFSLEPSKITYVTPVDPLIGNVAKPDDNAVKPGKDSASAAQKFLDNLKTTFGWMGSLLH